MLCRLTYVMTGRSPFAVLPLAIAPSSASPGQATSLAPAAYSTTARRTGAHQCRLTARGYLCSGFFTLCGLRSHAARSPSTTRSMTSARAVRWYWPGARPVSIDACPPSPMDARSAQSCSYSIERPGKAVRRKKMFSPALSRQSSGSQCGKMSLCGGGREVSPVCGMCGSREEYIRHRPCTTISKSREGESIRPPVAVGRDRRHTDDKVKVVVQELHGISLHEGDTVEATGT